MNIVERGPQWELYHKGMEADALRLSFFSNREYILAKDHYTATAHDNYLSLAYAVRDRLVERWIATQQVYHERNVKRVYYFSLEFLTGRQLDTNMINLGIEDDCAEALDELGVDLDAIREMESEAGLGNGGLGRLAACFLDSMATLGIPCHGYGIRYQYGIFRQEIVDGEQVEQPDEWLRLPNPWEIERPESIFKVKFYGRTAAHTDSSGRVRFSWEDAEEVLAVPYDIPVPGYASDTVNTLRLWSARASEEFAFAEFNSGDYMGAVERKTLSENVTKVLYPNDNFFEGRELRLKQEHLLVSASLQDIVRRFKTHNRDIRTLPEKVAIQLNDTHPALAIPELMRILLDVEGLDWEGAWPVVTQTFAYTNHTLLPEALEKWSVSLFGRLLPRHLEIIYEINRRFLGEVARSHPGDVDRIGRMSIIEEWPEKKIRMAHLAVVGSHHVNGVAQLHSALLRERLLGDFHDLWPERFSNKTNGVTQRRWMIKSNPTLSSLIDEKIGRRWRKDLFALRELESYADDPEFQARWADARAENKARLIEHIRREHGQTVNPESIFDSQIKRIHEYKRQLLFALWGIGMYLRLKERPSETFTPRILIFAGKAAPGYAAAKRIIRFINSVADTINRDPKVSDRLRIFFLKNYCVSLSERIIPGSDVSEQISTAGMEASGTGNMKFAMNGALTVGTYDGANLEIAREVGEENVFLFGHTADQIDTLRNSGYDPASWISRCPALRDVLNLIESGFFSLEDPGRFLPIVDSLTHGGDPFFIAADFPAFLECQDRIAERYSDRAGWTRMSILNVARSGKFSSDRTIIEYNRDIWRAPFVDMPAASRTRADLSG